MTSHRPLAPSFFKPILFMCNVLSTILVFLFDPANSLLLLIISAETFGQHREFLVSNSQKEAGKCSHCQKLYRPLPRKDSRVVGYYYQPYGPGCEFLSKSCFYEMIENIYP